MKTTSIVRTIAVFGVAAAVIAGAVHNASASVDLASATLDRADAQRQVRVMVTPRVANNDINLAQKNKAIEVAILAEQSWEFGDIDAQTVEFAGSIPAVSSTKSLDADNDGLTDRIYTFTTSKLKLSEADTTACLIFETIQKVKMRGCDKIKVLPAQIQK